MKWFKHDASANNDAKLKKVRIKYGMEGYGLYWYCLELIAQNVEKHNITFELEHDSEVIAHDTGIHVDRVNDMMSYMCNLGLFQSSNNVITCLSMAKRTDEYTAKLLIQLNKAGMSRQSPDSVPTKSDLIEENRQEQKRTERREEINNLYNDQALAEAFEVYWSSGMKKVAKKKALTSFSSIVKRQKKDPQEFAAFLAGDVGKRLAANQFGFDNMHPTTYLNQERWNDEISYRPSANQCQQRLSTVDRQHAAAADYLARLHSENGDQGHDGTVVATYE